MCRSRDLLQPVPECILEAHARFVPSDHDRTLEDQRFHEDTPICSKFDGTAFSAMAPSESGQHSPPIDPIIREWYCNHVPTRSRLIYRFTIIIPSHHGRHASVQLVTARP